MPASPRRTLSWRTSLGLSECTRHTWNLTIRWSGSTTADASPVSCADVVALKSSLQALTEVKPAQNGVAALTTAIANVKTSLDKAEASASPVLQPSVQQVKTAFDELQTAASGLTADNLREKAPAIASAIKEVATATQALSTKVNESCPGN